MPENANKYIVKVAKEVLQPRGFVKLRDRTWTHDGGYWLLHFNFDPSSYAQGCYCEIAIQSLLDWRPNLALGGIDAPRKYVELVAPFQFESELKQSLDELLAIADPVIARIQTPQDLLTQLDLSEGRSPTLKVAMLHAVCGEIERAKTVCDELASKEGDLDWVNVDRRMARFVKSLIDDRAKLMEFASILVAQSRAALAKLPSPGPKLPWES